MSISSVQLRYGLEGLPKYDDMQRIIKQALKEDAYRFVAHPSAPRGATIVRFTLSPAEGCSFDAGTTVRMKYVVAELRKLGLNNVTFRTLTKPDPAYVVRKMIEGYTISLPVETNLSLKMDESGMRPVHTRNALLDEMLSLLTDNPIQRYEDLYSALRVAPGLYVTPALVTEAIRHATQHGLIFAMVVQMPKSEIAAEDSTFMVDKTYIVNAGLRVATESSRVHMGSKRQAKPLHAVLREGLSVLFQQARDQESPTRTRRLVKKTAKTVPSKRVRTERTRRVEAGARMPR